MKHTICHIIIFSAIIVLAGFTPILAQEQDSLWNLDPEKYEFKNDFLKHYSHGWFPAPFSAFSLSFCSDFPYADIFDDARGIRSGAFMPTPNTFSTVNPFDSRAERRIKRSFSQENESDFPTSDYTEYSLQFLYNIPFLSVSARANAGLVMTDALLFSEDTTKRFLSHDGSIKKFREVNVLFTEEYLLKASLGMQIPVYGAFLDIESAKIASYYYLYGGMTGYYAVGSKTTQYAQIVGVKDELRYENGADTLRRLDEVTMDGLNRFRSAVDIAAGWHFAGEMFSFTFEGFISLPLTTILRDAEWKQYFAGLRVSLGYQWLSD